MIVIIRFLKINMSFRIRITLTGYLNNNLNYYSKLNNYQINCNAPKTFPRISGHKTLPRHATITVKFPKVTSQP